jgi:hypothetical protein
VKQGIAYFVFGAIALTTALPASAGVNVSVNLPFFGVGGYAPPVVYQPDPYPYYVSPPAVVYRGSGNWGGDRGGYSRGRHAGGGRGGEKHHK